MTYTKFKYWKGFIGYVTATLFAMGFIVLFGGVAKSAETLTGVDASSWMAFSGVLIGQFLAYGLRYYERNEERKEELSQSINMTESIINNFLAKEIHYNFKILSPIMKRIKRILNESEQGNGHYQFGFSAIQFKFDEYDKVKYEIIKYNNELTIGALEVYDLFYFLMDKKDLGNMSLQEIERIVEVYDKYEHKYVIKI